MLHEESDFILLGTPDLDQNLSVDPLPVNQALTRLFTKAPHVVAFYSIVSMFAQVGRSACRCSC